MATAAQRSAVFRILISGSKSPDAPRHEIERLRQVSEEIGKVLALPSIELLGAAEHGERVLASQSAKRGLHSANPHASFSTGTSSVDRFTHEDRLGLAASANGAIFIGGSSGTLEEYQICRAHHASPLIPIAAAGGTGATLAQRALIAPDEFWAASVDPTTATLLACPDASPDRYAKAVVDVLRASGVIQGGGTGWVSKLLRWIRGTRKVSSGVDRANEAEALLYLARDGRRVLMVQTFADRREWGGPSYHLVSPRRPLQRVLKVYGNRLHPVGEPTATRCIENAVVTILALNPDAIGLGGMGPTATAIRARLTSEGFTAQIGSWGKDAGGDAGDFLRGYGVDPSQW